MSKFLILLMLLLSNESDHIKRFDSSSSTPTTLKTGWYHVVDAKNSYQRQLYKSKENFYIDPAPIVSVKHFNEIDIKESTYQTPYILIQFDAYGTNAWSSATGKAAADNLRKEKFALIIDDKLVYAPQVEQQITSGVSALNRGDFSKEELEQFAKRIKSEIKSLK